MIKKIGCFILIIFFSIYSRDISFQLYVNDAQNNVPLSTSGVIPIKSVFVDANGNTYFLKNQNQKITNGILHFKVEVDDSDFSQLVVFDKPGLKLHLQLLDDELILPLSVVPIAILSKLSDRAIQIKDLSVMKINYIDKVINFGGSQSTANAVDVNGTLTATNFTGEGRYVYNAKGGGLNDDHSLEKLNSRTCPPNVSRSDCKYGEDVLFINNAPYVGINTKTPEMVFDTIGTVYFTAGEKDSGVINFPINKHQSIMAWDHQNASFKAGHVSRDISVNSNSFSHAAVSIGKDIATVGRNSAVFGGEFNTIYGDYSAIVGGKKNTINGDYSVLVNTDQDTVNQGYVTNVGGEGNQVSSNYAVLLRAKNNRLSGNNHTIVGETNLVKGESVIVHGSLNQVSGNNVIIMGNSAKVNHDNSWVINVSSRYLAQTTKPNQVIWMADKGISINTSNASQSLVVDGDLVGTYFYGNGSQLTNVSLVDKYWLMYADNMTNTGYNLGIKTSTLKSNRVNLGAGLRFFSDDSVKPGTISYKNGDLIAYGDTTTKSLLVQDQNTIYKTSSELSIINDTLHISTQNALANHFLVYDGQKWAPYAKSLWQEQASLISYSRPVSLWKSQQYLGMLTLANPVQNHLIFSNDSKTNGLTINLSGLEEKNQPISFGFNVKNLDSNQLFTTANSAYRFQFDSLSGGFVVNKMPNLKLMELNRNGMVNFFDGNFKMGVNIPTKSRLNNLIVDKDTHSSFAHVNYENSPFLSVDSVGSINIQAGGTATINFRILPDTVGSILNQTRLQMTNASELILSHDDAYALGRPMVIVPDGELIMDRDYYLGVYNSSRELQSGVSFHSDVMIFAPEKTQQNNVLLNKFGFGIRITPNHLIEMKDPVSSVFINKSAKNNSSYIIFSQLFSPKWTMHAYVGNSKSQLEIKNHLNSQILQMNDKININSPQNPNKDVNINGDFSFIDSSLYLTKTSNSQSPGTSKPFFKIANSQLLISPIDDTSGIGFHSNSGLQLNLNNGKVSIGSAVVPNSPTKSLYVNSGAYISNRLYLNDEKIEYKTIRTPGVIHSHRKENTVQVLSFDYDTGFDISSPSDNVVELTFQEHFSTFNTIKANQTVTSDTQFIQPNGIDMMSFDGDYISVSANNITSLGNPNGSMDSLVFFNDLMNGGVIDGDLEITGTLNVFGNDSNNEIHKLYGDISEMHMITFPWFHVTTENGNVVHHEYVITENVGIGTTTPQYPLEIVGISSINIVESPSMNVKGAFDSNKDYLTITSELSNFIATVNGSKSTTGPLLQFSNASLKDHSFGLNKLNDQFSMTLFPQNGSFDADVYIQGKQTSQVSIDNQFDMVTNLNGDLSLKALSGVNDVIFISKQSSVFVSKENALGINVLSPPKNSLDVSGNMVIGSALAGKIQAPINSVMVQSQLGIGTYQPKVVTDVNGSMVVATSGDTYLGQITGLSDDLVIEDKLFVESYSASVSENVLVKGSMTGVGGLFFNKHASNANLDELSIYSPQANLISFGYGLSVNDRSLSIFANDYVKFSPKPAIYGLYFNSIGFSGLGHEAPQSLLHIKKNNISFLIEADGTGDNHFKFEAGKDGLIGMVSNQPNHFVMSDGQNHLIAGSQFVIDANGSVDIGYNVADTSSGNVMPSHNVKLDVRDSLSAVHLLENGAVLTHMPEGSVVMWSGWTSELPEGWRFCTGTPSSTTTDKCNFVDYFVIGKESGQTLNDSRGQHEFAAATGTDYQHTHESSHNHGNFTQAGHNHNQAGWTAVPAKNETQNSDASNAGSGTRSGGKNGYSYSTRHWHREGCLCCGSGCWGHHETRWHWVSHSRQTGYTANNNGSHSHQITINHGHSARTQNKNHNHSLKEKGHSHANTEHSHNIKNEPEYYKLAFIYLVGDEQ